MARIQLAKSALFSVLFKATASLDNSDRQEKVVGGEGVYQNKEA